jgi:hypothetical protein
MGGAGVFFYRQTFMERIVGLGKFVEMYPVIERE